MYASEAFFKCLAKSRIVVVAITYGPLSAREEERQSNLRFIYHSNDTQCVELLRMRRLPFFHLCDLFRNRGLLRDIIPCYIEEQVAMFLHVVGHNETFRCIKFSFRRSVETISRYFQEVLYAVGELSSRMILPPSTKVQTRIQNSRRWNPYFKVTYYKLDSSIFRGYIC